jgi:hypothetical protein
MLNTLAEKLQMRYIHTFKGHSTIPFYHTPRSDDRFRGSGFHFPVSLKQSSNTGKLAIEIFNAVEKIALKNLAYPPETGQPDDQSLLPGSLYFVYPKQTFYHMRPSISPWCDYMQMEEHIENLMVDQ